MGFVRQLSAHEILSQVYLARQVIAEDGLPALHNVVFMGMGEPLNNIKHVAKAATVMSDHRYCYFHASSCQRGPRTREMTVGTATFMPHHVSGAHELER